MTKGCGVCDNHGGGCGIHDGETAVDCQLVGPAMPGKDSKPAGRPIPLLNGENDVPAGFANSDSLGIVSDIGCSGEGNLSPGADLAGVSAYEPGSSNCLNRSRSASCPGVGGAGGGGSPSDWNQLAAGFPF